MKEALCKAFCDAVTVRQVPVGLAVGTPFQRNGERLAFYVVFDKRDPTRARLEDDTLTITLLDAAGVNVFEGQRGEAFASMMQEAGVAFDEEEGVLHTSFMSLDSLPTAAIGFSAFLLRVQDFTLLTRERIENTFKEDVIKAVKDRFETRAKVSTNTYPDPSLRNYVADVVVKPPAYAPLAVYIGHSEVKALEALLLFQRKQILSIVCGVMLVVPDTPKQLKGRTRARMVDQFPVVPFVGHEASALNEMERLAFGQSTLVH